MSVVGEVGCTRQGMISTGADITLARNVSTTPHATLLRRRQLLSLRQRRRHVTDALEHRRGDRPRLASSRTTSQPHGCVLEPLGARIAASIISQSICSGTGSSLNLRIDRCVCTTSKKSMTDLSRYKAQSTSYL